MPPYPPRGTEVHPPQSMENTAVHQALNDLIYAIIGISEGQVFPSLIIRTHWLSILTCTCSYEKVP